MKTGHDLLALARTRIGEKYVFGALVPKDNRNCHGAWDCAEFVSWVIYQVAQILYGCDSNTGPPGRADAGTIYWARDARTKGTVISVGQAAGVPGAAVLRLAAGGLCGHIVLSDGRGGTIEAADSRRGVIASTVHGRRWSIGIMVPGIGYGNTEPPVPPLPVTPPTGTIYRLRLPYMYGEGVKQMQRALNLTEDGIYGRATTRAVQQFQAAHGLVADGEAGPLTLAALGVKI